MVDAPKHVTIDYDVPTDISFTHWATYTERKAWIQEHYNGMKVSSLYVAQIKDKHGLEKRENYNKSKKPDARVPQCPPEKEKAIEDALDRHLPESVFDEKVRCGQGYVCIEDDMPIHHPMI